MSDFRFATDDGVAKESTDAVFPIVKLANKTWHPIGTGFFINNSGLFLTAWHVLREALNSDGGMNCDGISAFHMLPNNQYLMRPILRSCHHRKSDIAIGLLAEAKHNDTGLLLTNSKMILTTAPQRVGSEIVTWAYPRTASGLEEGRQTLRFLPKFYGGILEEHYPVQRDSYLMPFPSYRGSINVLGGASGGPVVNLESGRVFGVNCTGTNGTGFASISYYSSLVALKDLWVENIVLDGKEYDHITVQELISQGQIDCD